MANISYKRLQCTTLVVSSKGGRVFNYDGATPNIDGSTDVLTIANTKAKSTWDTAVKSTFRKGDLILVSCTDGSLPCSVKSVDSATGIPTVDWLTTTATA